MALVNTTTWPDPAACIGGITACRAWNTMSRLTRLTFSHRARSISRNGPTTIDPVTKQAESMRPNRSSAACTTARLPSAVVKSASGTSSTSAPKAANPRTDLFERHLDRSQRPDAVQHEVVAVDGESTCEGWTHVAGGHRDQCDGSG